MSLLGTMTFTERLDVWLPIVFFSLLWSFMQWHGKLPQTKSIQHFVSIINSRGGNILILIASSIYFFKYSMYLFMHLLEMVKDKTIAPDNAFALMAVQFITTSAFGGSMGALLKTMTGESSTARITDNIPPGTTNTKEITTKDITAKSPVVDNTITPKEKENAADNALTQAVTTEDADNNVQGNV